MLMAQGAESGGASLVGSQCGWWVLESIGGLKKAVQKLPCQRMLGSATVRCDYCRAKMEAGTYWRKFFFFNFVWSV
jgi:hypothetical protein